MLVGLALAITAAADHAGATGYVLQTSAGAIHLRSLRAASPMHCQSCGAMR
jgi:hypothetical protein